MPVSIEAIISPERLSTYRKAVGHDLNRALDLYAWNMKLSASFTPLLGATEISLRNLIMFRVAEVFGVTWWQSQALFNVLGGEGKGIIKRAENKITACRLAVDGNRMTAELSFGFWQNMLLPKYADPLWTPLHRNFPDLPAHVDQATLYRKCRVVRDLRNRISHHEPIFQRNISQDYSNCLELLSWLSVAKANWIKPHCDVMALLRKKP